MDRLLTADELAALLGVKTQWIWAQARAGRIPHVRLGRYRRFRESAVEAWLRDLEAESTLLPLFAPTAVPLRRRARTTRGESPRTSGSSPEPASRKKKMDPNWTPWRFPAPTRRG
jgi:excisionase family DNA binding protein